MSRRLLLAALLAALVAIPSAGGAPTAATPWPVTRISVWNDTGYTGAVAQAMDAWNGVGTRVELVPAKSRSGARVVVGYLERAAFTGQVGQGSLGWSPAGRGHVSIVRGLGKRLATVVAAHELGHVLGLGHPSRPCSIMAATVEGASSLPDCGLGRCARLAACLVQPQDALELRSLYEDRLPSLRPRPVGEVIGRQAPGWASALHVRWLSPADGPGGAVLVRAARGACPLSPYGQPLARTQLLSLRHGERQELVLPVEGKGEWCAGVWVQETASYITSRVSYARVFVR